MTLTTTRPDYAVARKAMIDSQLRTSGVNDAFVLERMGSVPREDFVPENAKANAYMDRAIRLEDGGFLPAPLFHGAMLAEARPGADDRVLVVGAADRSASRVIVGARSGAQLVPAPAHRPQRAVEEVLELGELAVDVDVAFAAQPVGLGGLDGQLAHHPCAHPSLDLVEETCPRRVERVVEIEDPCPDMREIGGIVSGGIGAEHVGHGATLWSRAGRGKPGAG